MPGRIIGRTGGGHLAFEKAVETGVDGASAAAVGALALVHLEARRLRFLDRLPRSRWLSFAGGVSVAYVFLHLLPELAAAQEAVAPVARGIDWLDHHVWLLALAGLVSYYALERGVRQHRRRRGHGEASDSGVFALHLGAFALYNLLLGVLFGGRPRLAGGGWALL
jgi:zinc transporter ZupT